MDFLRTMDPTLRELAGGTLYALLVLIVTHGLLTDRLDRPRDRSRLLVFSATAGAFALAALFATLTALVINHFAPQADFCHYFILALATMVGPMLALAWHKRLAPARKYTTVLLLGMALLEVLAIPKFLGVS